MGVKDLSLPNIKQTAAKEMTKAKNIPKNQPLRNYNGKSVLTTFSNSKTPLYQLKRKEIKLPNITTLPGSTSGRTPTPLKNGGMKPKARRTHLRVDLFASKALLHTKDEDSSCIQRESHFTLRKCTCPHLKMSKPAQELDDSLPARVRSRTAVPEKELEDCKRLQVSLPSLERQDSVSNLKTSKGLINGSNFAVGLDNPVGFVCRGSNSKISSASSNHIKSINEHDNTESFSQKAAEIDCSPPNVPELNLTKVLNSQSNGNDHCSVINLTIPFPVLTRNQHKNYRETSEEDVKDRSAKRKSSNVTEVPMRRKSTKHLSRSGWENEKDTSSGISEKDLNPAGLDRHSKI